MPSPLPPLNKLLRTEMLHVELLRMFHMEVPQRIVRPCPTFHMEGFLCALPLRARIHVDALDCAAHALATFHVEPDPPVCRSPMTQEF